MAMRERQIKAELAAALKPQSLREKFTAHCRRCDVDLTLLEGTDLAARQSALVQLLEHQAPHLLPKLLAQCDALLEGRV